MKKILSLNSIKNKILRQRNDLSDLIKTAVHRYNNDASDVFNDWFMLLNGTERIQVRNHLGIK